jgi:hypothetical protein
MILRVAMMNTTDFWDGPTVSFVRLKAAYKAVTPYMLVGTFSVKDKVFVLI